jgi:hypothetical protein
MNNRYNELSKEQQDLFDQMINGVASERLTITKDGVQKMSTTVRVVRVRKAGNENLYDPTYYVDPTRDELLELLSNMGDVNINYFYQDTETGAFARRSRVSSHIVTWERQVDETLPPIVIAYTRKDGIEKSWAVNVGPTRRSR